MSRTAQHIRPSFARPVQQVIMMIVVLALVGVGAWLAYPRVAPIFAANPYLNGVIGAVFVAGVLACVWQIVSLIAAVRWIEGFANGDPARTRETAPRLVASLAGLLGSRKARMQLSANSSRSILDSVAARLDEARDITRYIVNLLIFLGLLGTFYGLATTVPAVVETIRSLDPAEGEAGVDVFSRLMGGLETQLGGMGTAFASSLLGLAGSLVVGLLELFVGHGQNRFYRELEEWLSTITKVGFASSEVEGGGFDMDVVAQVLDHMVAQIESLQDLFVQADERAERLDVRLTGVAQSVTALTGQLQRNDAAVEALGQVAAGQTRIIEGQARSAEVQERVAALLERQITAGATADHGIDAESKMRLRSIDVQLLRILEDMAAGRQEAISELRGDLAALNMTIKQAARAGATDPAAIAAEALRTVMHDDFDPATGSMQSQRREPE
ncbi:biopolymer transporter ExbB [Tropicimonas sp. S265A]|uniref:biopolymer transporter ExbB n=1 Tax=Tropicimonas sp. S265A TaxID=3415134 RepID=UPI003C7D2998